MANPVIELRDVTKTFGSFTAISNASFQIQPGEVVGFVGANGAGKTTTINMLLGFTGASSGTIKLFGKTVHPQNAHVLHERIGYASGDMELPSQLTGRQYLSFLLHQSSGDHRENYAALCKRFMPQLDKKIHQLSRGNKQKIALVAAFVTDPDVIILDEPTSGLDPAMQETFLALIREYQQQKKTVFMSSHYLQEVSDVCSRVILMREGKIIQDVTTKELLTASGKLITIKTSYAATKPPKHAESVQQSREDDVTSLSFVFKGEMAELQRWLAGVKQLQDIQVSEYDLEGAFHSLYQPEEQPS